MDPHYSQRNSKGVEYFLNTREFTFKNGATVRAYYFSKVLRPETACALPSDKQVVESKRSSLLFIKNK